MSGSIKTRSMAKGNEAARGDASTAPDNPGNSRIREERGHEACALSYNTTMTQIVALFYGTRAEPERFCIVRATRKSLYDVK